MSKNLSLLPPSAVSRILSDIKYQALPKKTTSGSNKLIKFIGNKLVSQQLREQHVKSRSHPIAKHLLRLSTSSKYRHNKNSTLLTSKKLIVDYCAHGRCLLKAYAHSVNSLPKGVQFGKLILVSKHILKAVARVKTFDGGILGEVPLPKAVDADKLREGRRILAIKYSKGSGKREDNHLGTLIRSALAMRWNGIWLIGDGHPDFLDPHTMRVMQGSIYHLPFRYGSLNELTEFAKENSFNLYTIAAQNNTNSAPTIKIEGLNNEKRVILLINKYAKDISAQATGYQDYPSCCIDISHSTHSEYPISIDFTTRAALVMYHLT